MDVPRPAIAQPDAPGHRLMLAFGCLVVLALGAGSLSDFAGRFADSLAH